MSFQRLTVKVGRRLEIIKGESWLKGDIMEGGLKGRWITLLKLIGRILKNEGLTGTQWRLVGVSEQLVIIKLQIKGQLQSNGKIYI